MEYSSIFPVLTNFISIIGCYFLIRVGNRLFEILLFIASVYLIVSVINFIFTTRRYKSFQLQFNFGFAQDLLKQSIPLMLAGFIGYFAFQLSILMLSKMKTNAEVGFFSAPFRLIEGLILFPTGFMNAIFPTLSRYSRDSFEKLKSAYQLSIRTLSVCGVILAIGVTVLSNKIIHIFYGQNFVNSIVPLIILIWALFFVYIVAIFYNLLLAANKQNTVIVIQLICLLVSFLTNFLLIPKYSYIGAAISVLITQIFSLFLFAIIVYTKLFNKLKVKNVKI